jgi:GT2 family glycosyltransferase
MPNSKKISVIIVNYKSENYLSNCLKSVYKQIDAEILADLTLVNNGTNGSLEKIQKEFPEIKIIESGTNIGYGAAGNLAAKNAQGNFLLFLNPDAEIITFDFPEVLKEFQGNLQLAVLGARLIGADGKNQSWGAGREIDLVDIILNNLGYWRSRKIWESQKVIEADWVSGAALFIKKEDFLSGGGFDENFFLYFEDIDLCRRLKKTGKKIIYYPAWQVKHLGGKSFLGKNKQKKEFYQSQDYYFDKHYGKLQSFLVKTLRRVFVGKI